MMEFVDFVSGREF